MELPFTFIQSFAELEVAAQEWSKLSEIAIDLECENNLHHYGSYITLIQLSSRTKNWIIDALAVTKMDPFIKMLENPSIRKFFHDVSFDLRIICHQWPCRLKNIFDTQIAALFLGKKEVGLGYLLESYFGVHKMHKFQMADWTKRPISDEMLSYAVTDTLHLLALKDHLTAELKELGRLSWVEEECAFIEQRPWEYTEGTFSDLKGFNAVTDKERGIIKSIFHLRDKIAKRVDRPVHFVLSNSLLMKLAAAPPSLSDWQNMRGVHPVVRRETLQFHKAVEEGKKHPLLKKELERKRFTSEQKKIVEQLEGTRDILAAKLGIARHLIINQDQIIQIALSGKYDCLRSWQKKLVMGKVTVEN